MDTETTAHTHPIEDAYPIAAASTTVEAPTPFDFGENRDNKNHQWHPRDPKTGEPITGVTFYVAGEDTSEYRKVLAEAQRALAQRALRSKNQQQEIDQFALDVAVGVLLEWEQDGKPTLRWHGQELPCTAENRRKVLSGVRWLFDQFREFLNDREQRLGKS